MSLSLASSIDALGRWRHSLDDHLRALQRFLGEFDLLTDATGQTIETLRQRVNSERLVVAFVAEFSRGKSELINAIFFADTKRRVLPATPGRTTMCPVELGFDAAEAPALALLPIRTRLEKLSLVELRQRSEAWKLVPLNPSDSAHLALALKEVTATLWVDQSEARALGFWSDERPQDNPSCDAAGRVEVPAWRHAMINYPHPLLKQGLVVLDTPGLNAIGAEAELTLGLLPSAHAAVFILGADTGVTKSDLTVWQEHLGPQSLARFVALNKIDALADPLLSPEQIEAQIQQQRKQVSSTLSIPIERIFPVSARQALTGRIEDNPELLAQSRLPFLEEALSTQLLPQRRAVLAEATTHIVKELNDGLLRQLADQRRQLAEQMIELRGLRGKNTSKVSLLLRRVAQESAEFEQCTARLQAMRTVHVRMLNEALACVAADRVRDAVEEMRRTIKSSILNLGARKAFHAMCSQLRNALHQAQTQAVEIHTMLSSYFIRLNTDFGFNLQIGSPVDLSRFFNDLELIERNYEQYLGLSQAWRLSQPQFMEQFRRMLLSRLRVIFDAACTEIEQSNKNASSQVDTQLRERRRDFRRRRESLEKIQSAGINLEERIADIESQHDASQRMQGRLQELLNAILQSTLAATAPVEGSEAFSPTRNSSYSTVFNDPNDATEGSDRSDANEFLPSETGALMPLVSSSSKALKLFGTDEVDIPLDLDFDLNPEAESDAEEDPSLDLDLELDLDFPPSKSSF
jgi:hypothetical protein